MPTFEFEAQDAAGKPIRGQVFGASLDSALADLGRRGLQVSNIGAAVNHNDPLSQVAAESVPMEARPVEVDRSLPAPAPLEQRSYMQTNVWGPLVGQVSLKDLAFFFRQSATMIHAGVPIVQTIDTLATQAREPKFKQILREMTGAVKEGHSMSDTMQRYPEVFGMIMVSMTRAGERGGFMDTALTYTADYLDKEIALRALFKKLTFYPKLQVGASILIILAANAIIVAVRPEGQQIQSPLTTAATWVILAPIIIGIFLFFRVGLKNLAVKATFDRMLLKLPGIGTMIMEMSMAKFGRAFAALHKSGLPLSESMKLSADACGNEYLRGLMYPAIKRLETGGTIYETLRDTRAFSPMVLDMVATGETTGNLDYMLQKVGEFYEEEATAKSTQAAYITGTILALIVGVYIGYIIITFYSGYTAGLMRAGE